MLMSNVGLHHALFLRLLPLMLLVLFLQRSLSLSLSLSLLLVMLLPVLRCIPSLPLVLLLLLLLLLLLPLLPLLLLLWSPRELLSHLLPLTVTATIVKGDAGANGTCCALGSGGKDEQDRRRR